MKNNTIKDIITVIADGIVVVYIVKTCSKIEDKKMKYFAAFSKWTSYKIGGIISDYLIEKYNPVKSIENDANEES